MFPVRFRKDRCAEVVHALNNGLPITVPPEGWSQREMFLLAGVLHFGVASHGPPAIGYLDYDAVSDEQKEAYKGDHIRDMFSALAFVAQLAANVVDDEYELPETVEAVVQGTDRDYDWGGNVQIVQRPDTGTPSTGLGI